MLAKEFVVDPRQLPLSARRAPTRSSCSRLHPARRLAALVDAALDLGLEPLVEAHDARELDRALGTRARVVGINNRDLVTLDVDPERAVRLHGQIPADRLAIAESASRSVDRGRLAGGRVRRRARRRGPDARRRPGRGRPCVRRRRRARMTRRLRPPPIREDLRSDRCGRRRGRAPRRRRRDRAQPRPRDAARAVARGSGCAGPRRPGGELGGTQPRRGCDHRRRPAGATGRGSSRPWTRTRSSSAATSGPSSPRVVRDPPGRCSTAGRRATGPTGQDRTPPPAG